MLKSFVACLLLLSAALGARAAEPNHAALIERGKVLMNGVVACGNCHTPRDEKGALIAAKTLAGGMLFDDPPIKAYARNITPDPETGIGRWTDAQLKKAIREGIRPDGSLIGPPMPFEFYRHLADRDLDAIVAYIRAQPAVKNDVPKSTFAMPLPKAWGPAVGSVKAPPAGATVKYGEYLATIAHCMECHTQHDEKGALIRSRWGAGGFVFKGPWGESVSRNLTPDASGLKNWTDAQIAHAIRTGTDRNGHPYRPPMGFDFYKNIGDADMKALILYLRSLKPLPSAAKS